MYQAFYGLRERPFDLTPNRRFLLLTPKHEEALCNLIAYQAMAQFSEEKYGPKAREHLAIARYTRVEARRTHTVKALYEQLAGHYARFERNELSTEALLP